MEKYITGDVIRELRKRKKMTQEELANRLFVSGKAISKWETGNGLPDISLLEPLAKALDISVIELLSGDLIFNRNKAANIVKSKIYVCPVCGNVIQTTGAAAVSCCGVTLPPLEPEEPDQDHEIRVEMIENEYFISLQHPMTKEHYISFLAAVSDQRMEFVKLYPEGGAEARFPINGVIKFYAYCNRHGLFALRLL